MGKKRSGEQALRDDYKAANKAVTDAKVRLEAISITRKNVNKAYEEQQLVLKAAFDRRDRVNAALEALLGDEIKEVSDGESAAPATTGADAEVQQGEPDK